MADKPEQVAALTLSWNRKDKLKVLLVTSRETGRWIIPKGWMMSGMDPWKTAEIEALEEAGATGLVAREVIGQYEYEKALSDGSTVTCRVDVYPMVIRRLNAKWKEANHRERRWFSQPEPAAELVNEARLHDLLLSLMDKSVEAALRDLISR